jgi:Heparinase II/III-like protein/Heparinase II/III N-terminus
MARIALYLDAARALQLRQILWRIRRLIPPALLAAGTRVRPDVSARPVAGGLGRSPAPQGGPAAPAHETGMFAGYGTSRRFGEEGFWDDPRDGLLFLFHLHGFSPLAEYAAGERNSAGDAFWAQVVESWLSQHDHPTKPAWHPYPTSVRVIAWSAALSEIEGWPGELRRRLAAAILQQARYLSRTVEHDIGGNHVLKNASALAFAGSLFPESGLLPSGLSLLRRELAGQVLPDGGHEERSTSYHREVARDLNDVKELLLRAGERVPAWLDESLRRMELWLRAVTGPDGRLPLLNDAWDGPPVGAGETDEMTELADTGYLVLRHDRDQLLFDAAPVCPPHLPPHAHADALSFVLWADEQPLVIDPGSYTYSGEGRERFRSTAAHNTVEVDARDQCEFWGDFRAAHLPNVAPAQVMRQDELVVATSRHDGYRRLSDPVEHERSIVWWPGWGVVVLDRLLGEGCHEVSSRLHCAPEATPVGPGRLGPFELTALGVADPAVRVGLYSPYLGSSRPAPVIEIRFEVAPGQIFGWSLLRPGARVVAASDELLEVKRQGKRLRSPSFLARAP